MIERRVRPPAIGDGDDPSIAVIFRSSRLELLKASYLSQTTVTSELTPHLLVRTEVGHRYLPLIGKSYWTLGRGKDNNFVFRDRWISRNHAMLQQMDRGEFFWIDLGSRNGSFVNDRRVTIPVALKDGDRIRLGGTELEFHAPSPCEDCRTPETDAEDFTSALKFRCLVSVMVMDIRNFPTLTRQLDEEVLSEVMGVWFRQAGQIVRDHGSWVDKYIGNAIMAVWFHGTRDVNPQELLLLFSAVSNLNRVAVRLTHTYSLPRPFRVSAGVNTGYGMAGTRGGEDTSEYTALGDTVNAAFRLELSTREIDRDIVVGETTYQYLTALNPGPTFSAYTLQLPGDDAPTVAYAGEFAAIDAFLRQAD